jgi:putative nucleotidyltransferase with HDIG domain
LRLNLPGSDPRLAQTVRFFEDRHVASWAAGGFVRDHLLGRAPRDIDLTTDGPPVELGRELAGEIGAAFVIMDEARGHVRLVLPGDGRIDLTPLRADAIDADLRLRDFTVDAMAVQLTPVTATMGELLDPTGGRNDLRDGLIRMTGQAALADDPLRLLRGVRLCAELDFGLEEETRSRISAGAAEINTVAPERLRDELARIMATDRAAAGLRLMDELGLLVAVLPEVEVMRDVEQPKEHYFDVLRHSLAAVEALDAMLGADQPGEARERAMWTAVRQGLPPAVLAALEEQLGSASRLSLLKLGALLHDIGKPGTKSVEAGGRVRFFGHAELGAQIASRLMARLRYSSRATAMVAAMIRAHLRPLQMSQSGAPSNRAVYRYFRDAGDAGAETLLLSLADHAATAGPRLDPEQFRRHVGLVAYTLQMRDERPTVVKPRKLIRGDELAAELGIVAGPGLRDVLEKIAEAQAAGEVNDRDGAVEFARRLIGDRR